MPADLHELPLLILQYIRRSSATLLRLSIQSQRYVTLASPDVISSVPLTGSGYIAVDETRV